MNNCITNIIHREFQSNYISSIIYNAEHIRTEIMKEPNVELGYCNILSDKVYKLLYGDREKNEIPLQEENGNILYNI